MATNGRKGRARQATEKRVTRYSFDDASDPRTPETGHTPLLPSDELSVTLPMDNGWTHAIATATLPDDDERPVIVDMDPVVDPVLFWAGKRSKREIPVLPLQRNEIVTESRIGQIIERARRAAGTTRAEQIAFFADLEKNLRESDKNKRVEFYTHDEQWKNKLICGDSLQVMESLINYEGLRGAVQMIYVDPPYGIKYDSNFQQRIDSTKNDDRDRADDVLTIKAFRDTWSLGIHSYLSYISERLYLCRDLLASTGSVFVQISDANVHRCRLVMDEVFGAENFCGEIAFAKTSGFTSSMLSSVFDVLLWYAKDKKMAESKYHPLFEPRPLIDNPYERYICVETPDEEIIDLSVAQKLGKEPIPEGRILRLQQTSSQGETESSRIGVDFDGKTYFPPRGRHWSVSPDRLPAVASLGRLFGVGNTLTWKQYRDEFPYRPINNIWTDIRSTGFGESKVYVVQTLPEVLERCVLMTTDPADLVFDPTCGSGTTALTAEKFGRRWITCDTSRIAINITRRRLLSVIYPHYRTRGEKISDGLIYEEAERITLGSIAYSREPEKIQLVDRPLVDSKSVRVAGPFEVMSLGRYSLEDWKGYVTESGKLENYIEVICRLYRRDTALQRAIGLIHATAESEQEKIAISVGPISGRVTAKQIHDAVEDALAMGILEVHVLGWAFEANVGEVKSRLESRGRVKVQLVVIRPDTLAEGLRASQPEMLFAPLSVPDVDVAPVAGDDGAERYEITLKGVGVFDRKRRTTDYHMPDSGYISAWYLDEDYDGDCFVDCQMFFDFAKVPSLRGIVVVDPDEFELKATSESFSPGGYRRVAVKVVDVYGNESTVVRDL